MEQLMNDLAALLELEGENISPEAIMEGVRQLKTSVDAVKEATDAPEEAATPEQLVEAVTDYVEDEVKKEVASRMQKATASADPSKFVPIEVLKQVQQQVASLVASEKETKATAAVDAAVKAGKIIPAQRDWAKSYASADLKGFESYVAGAPVIVASGGATGATIATASANGGLDAEHAAIAKQLGVSAETFKANLKK
jgi:phage I-like protein